MTRFFHGYASATKAWLTIAVVVGVLALAADCARAECPPKVEPHSFKLVQQGQPGIWLHIEVMRCIEMDLERFDIAVDKVAKLEDQLAKRESQVALYKDADKEASMEIGALEKTVGELSGLLDSLDAWYRSPWLWLGVGLVVGVGGTTVLVVSL